MIKKNKHYIQKLNIAKNVLFIFFSLAFLQSSLADQTYSNKKWLSLNKSGMLSHKLEEYDKAEHFYLLAIKEAESINAEKELSATFNNLGLLFLDQLKLDSANQMLEKSFRIRMSVYGPMHRYTAQASNNLGRVREALGKYEEAERLYSGAIYSYEKMGKAGEIFLVGSMINLAGMFQKVGKIETSYDLNIRALDICKNSLGTSHPKTLLVINNLAGVMFELGYVEEAENLYLELLNYRKKDDLENERKYAKILNNIAVIYKSQCRLKEAKEKLLLSLDIWKKLKNNDPLSFSGTLNNLAEIYRVNLSYDQANNTYLEALKVIAGTAGENHQLYIDQLGYYIKFLFHVNRDSEAISFIEKLNKILLRKGLPKTNSDEFTSNMESSCGNPV